MIVVFKDPLRSLATLAEGARLSRVRMGAAPSVAAKRGGAVGDIALLSLALLLPLGRVPARHAHSCQVQSCPVSPSEAGRDVHRVARAALLPLPRVWLAQPHASAR